MKFRKKKLDFFSNKSLNYNKIVTFVQNLYDQKIKTYLISTSTFSFKNFDFYINILNANLQKEYINSFSLIKHDSSVIDFISKLKKEIKRLLKFNQ